MPRTLDREIEYWSRKPLAEQLSLLWREIERDEVKVISWWEDEPWGSPYVISASQPKRVGPGKWWAVCFINPGRPETTEISFSDEGEVTGHLEPGANARELRRMLDIPGVDERREFCDLLVDLGYRRDEMDLPMLRGFSGHQSRTVRYVVLGCLSWQPSVSNAQLGEIFGGDPDPKVRGLALDFAGGKVRRRTRA